MAIMDISHMVMGAILANYPTDTVDKNLSPTASLSDDLGLSSMDIYYLGLCVEKEMPRGSFTDEQIMSWRTVQDIIDSVAQNPDIENKEIPI